MINDAVMSVKMDKHDWDKENPKESGSGGSCPMTYVVAGILVISLAAAVYKSWQIKK